MVTEKMAAVAEILRMVLAAVMVPMTAVPVVLGVTGAPVVTVVTAQAGMVGSLSAWLFIRM